jgi:hypothetical protein
MGHPQKKIELENKVVELRFSSWDS